MTNLELVVNGRVENVDIGPAESLLDMLRNRLHLLGTKDGCREGECGACTVLIDGKPVNSCIYPAKSAQGHSIETIEGLRDEKDIVLQRTLVKTHGVQCGYCTPGFVMTLTALLRQHPNPSEELVREAVNGNICRCTGYSQIIDAVMEVAGQESGVAS